MKLSFIILSPFLMVSAFANDFVSPNKLLETCRITPHLANVKYSDKDRKREKELCALNFYDSVKFKLCPKNWSTSPGTIVLGLEETPFTASTCLNKKAMDPYHKEAKFKISMNMQGTSSTFSQAHILYYHLSRFFKSSVDTPVAVYRTMDKSAHYDMVASKVANLENDMVKAGWDHLKRAESESVEAVYPWNETFTNDGQQVYGALVDTIGNGKYGEHIRGVKGPWGEPQHVEIQNTPAFVALASAYSMVAAGESALDKTSSRFPKELANHRPSSFQMMGWMQEMSDMTILDYILTQQDRPGNIHFQWRVMYAENGKLKSKRVKVENKYKYYNDYDKVEKIALKQFKAKCQKTKCFVVQKTTLEDNDAAVKIEYHDFYRRSGVLKSFRHLSPNSYVKLLSLAADFQTQGSIYQHIKKYVNITPAQLEQIVYNTIDAANILSKNCKKIRFDLDTEKYMLTGQVSEVSGLCEKF